MQTCIKCGAPPHKPDALYCHTHVRPYIRRSNIALGLLAILLGAIAIIFRATEASIATSLVTGIGAVVFGTMLLALYRERDEGMNVRDLMGALIVFSGALGMAFTSIVLEGNEGAVVYYGPASGFGVALVGLVVFFWPFSSHEEDNT